MDENPQNYEEVSLQDSVDDLYLIEKSEEEITTELIIKRSWKDKIRLKYNQAKTFIQTRNIKTLLIVGGTVIGLIVIVIIICV